MLKSWQGRQCGYLLVVLILKYSNHCISSRGLGVWCPLLVPDGEGSGLGIVILFCLIYHNTYKSNSLAEFLSLKKTFLRRKTLIF
jgi:hypothetical protein